MGKKRLILNIDDAGFSEEVNEAAGECLSAGRATGVSVMANGAEFEPFIEILEGIKINEAGVHLVLTGGMDPLTKNKSLVSSLTDSNGQFYENLSQLMPKYFFGAVNIKEIYNEFFLQITALKERGIIVTHIDSHEHIHMLPGVAKVVIELAKQHNIPFIRLSRERTNVIGWDYTIKDILRHFSLKCFSSFCKKILAGSGVLSNDFFAGHYHAGRIDTDILYFLIENMPEGITEIGMHPAKVTEDFIYKHPWYKAAENEFNAIMNEKWSKILIEKDIELVTHKEALS